MKKLLISLTVLTIVLLTSNCSDDEPAKASATPAPSPSNNLTIKGSTTLLPIVEMAVEAFKKKKPEINVTYNSSGSQIGINALTDGYTDIALSSRELKKEEKQKLHARNKDAKETIVAWDGIIPIVHPSNLVKNLTLAQLKDIYTGKVTDWQQLGGKPGKILVVTRDNSSGTHEAWAELVLNNEPVLSSAQERLTSEEMLEMIANTPNAIGYDGIGYVEGTQRVKPISVEGTMASASSILDKSYKIARPLYMFSGVKTTTAVIEFLQFMTSPEGQAAVKEARFVPLPSAGN